MHLPADDTSQWPLLPPSGSSRLSKSSLPLMTILLHDNRPFCFPPSDFPFTFKYRIIAFSVKSMPLTPATAQFFIYISKTNRAFLFKFLLKNALPVANQPLLR